MFAVHTLHCCYTCTQVRMYMRVCTLSCFSIACVRTCVAALEATLEPPLRETSPTYSGDYHSGRRLPGNKRSLAVERRKKGQQQNEGSDEEEE